MQREVSAYLSTRQVARQCDVSDAMVRIWVKQGKLTPIPTALGMLFDPAIVARFAREREDRRAARKAVAS